MPSRERLVRQLPTDAYERNYKSEAGSNACSRSYTNTADFHLSVEYVVPRQLTVQGCQAAWLFAAK